MRRPSPRPFHPGDLIILVAAVAGGFALRRWADAPIDRKLLMRAATGSTTTSALPGNRFDAIRLGPPSHHAWAATLGLVVCRWRRPRRPAVRVLRQPGAVACLAVVGATALGFALYRVQEGLRIGDPDGPPLSLRNDMARDGAARWAAPAVIGAWTALALRGAWTPERSGIDRAGRTLGLHWLIHAPANQLCWPFLDRYLAMPQPIDFAP